VWKQIQLIRVSGPSIISTASTTWSKVVLNPGVNGVLKTYGKYFQETTSSLQNPIILIRDDLSCSPNLVISNSTLAYYPSSVKDYSTNETTHEISYSLVYLNTLNSYKACWCSGPGVSSCRTQVGTVVVAVKTDCKLSTFWLRTACDKTCGGGVEIWQRSVVTWDSGGGIPCPSTNVNDPAYLKEVQCAQQSCPILQADSTVLVTAENLEKVTQGY
jgi:hypothetical protein